MSKKNSLLRQLADQVPTAERKLYRKADDIAARIIQLMQERCLNQEQLAKKLGKHKSYVSRVLGGGVNLTLKTIAEFEAALDADIVSVPVARQQPARRRLSSVAMAATTETVKEESTVTAVLWKNASSAHSYSEDFMLFTSCLHGVLQPFETQTFKAWTPACLAWSKHSLALFHYIEEGSDWITRWEEPPHRLQKRRLHHAQLYTVSGSETDSDEGGIQDPLLRAVYKASLCSKLTRD